MNYLFVLNHPGHYHLFKHTIIALSKKGYECEVLAKEKDILLTLLDNDGINYIIFKNKWFKKRNNVGSSFFGLFNKCRFLLDHVKKCRKPLIMVGTDWAIALVGRRLNIPAVVFNEDDTRATPENLMFYPFAKSLVLPDCCDKDLWKLKKTTYPGYHELAYLHPNRFKFDRGIVKELIPDDKPYIIIRLVSLTASHDIGKRGLAKDILSQLVALLQKKYKVLISFEGKVLEGFEKFQYKFKPSLMHHFLAGAAMVIGDSQTMIAEAAILGTPAIRFNDFVGRLSYLEELERKYHLAQGFKTNQVKEFLVAVNSLADNYPTKEENQKKLNKMLANKIDVSTFIIDYLITYYAVQVRNRQVFNSKELKNHGNKDI